MSRKDSAAMFLKLAGTGKTEDAYARFIAPDFIHHNQYFRGDRTSPSFIFRFKGDKVVELWDLGQLLIKDSPNENGAF